MKKMTTYYIIAIGLLGFILPSQGQIHYVKQDGTGDGSSWENASGDLQSVLDSAAINDAIYIATGTYRPTSCSPCSESDRANSFVITKPVKIYGGFSNENCTGFGVRDFELYPTVLSADIGMQDDFTDNAYHVIRSDFEDSEEEVLLSGINIVGGYANGPEEENQQGAGIWMDNGFLRIEDCLFSNNNSVGLGGAFFSKTNIAQFDYCNFNNNTALSGAAIATTSEEDNRITNCKFENNVVTDKGGAIYVDAEAYIQIYSCSFFQNMAPVGAAIYLEHTVRYRRETSYSVHYSNSKVVHSTFVNNSSTEGGPVIYIDYIEHYDFYVANSIMWSNTTPLLMVDSSAVDQDDFYILNFLTDVSDIEGIGNSEFVNINEELIFFGVHDPFVDMAAGDLRLRSNASAIARAHVNFDSDACESDDDDYCGGEDDDDDPTYYNHTMAAVSDFDLQKNYRNIGRPDLGAYEMVPELNDTNIDRIYVNPNATGNNSGLSWEDACTNLSMAFRVAKSYIVKEIWIAEGTYTPDGCAYRNCNSEDRVFQLDFRNEGHVLLYGGFPATGNPTFEQRDYNAFPTIISGEVGDPNTIDDNLEVLMQESYFARSEITIDGLIFTGAEREALRSNDIVLRNCTFHNNATGLDLFTFRDLCHGDGILWNCHFYDNTNSAIEMGNEADLVMDYCTFENNSSPTVGGAIRSRSNMNFNVFGTFNACKFYGNSAVEAGGALYINRPYNFHITNSIFANNHSAQGGAIASKRNGGSTYLTNCAFYNNTATTSGAIAGFNGDEDDEPNIYCRNSILWHTDTVTLSDRPIDFSDILSNHSTCTDLSAIADCSGTFLHDTLSPFIDPLNSDFKLHANSMAINAGANDHLTSSSFPFDHDKNNRVHNGTVDLGPYEVDPSIIDIDSDGIPAEFDCDDNNPFVNWYQLERPYNGVDDDCNPLTLDDDLDQDGYTLMEDCDDSNPNIHANSIEIPYDGIDNDCNPLTKDDDLDGDGFGLDMDCNDNNINVGPCVAETPYDGLDNDCNPFTLDDDLDQDGFVLAEDCDDNNPLVNPNVEEIPFNGIDDDCNSNTPDNDLDQDGIPADLDCDDSDPYVFPGAVETPYNGIDDDCNSATLDDDLDQDGFGISEDCDDTDATINPDNIEIPYNGIDDDCNELTLDDDLDQDGYPQAEDCDDNNPLVNSGLPEISYNGLDDDCDAATLDDDLDQDGFGIENDCDDNNPYISPGQSEIPYNGIDDDCDEQTLDDDFDQDGYPIAEDCDDNNPLVNSGLTEIPYNGLDDDCNSATLDDDLDQDGFGIATDCDDTNPEINPVAIEIPNNEIDEDCNGEDAIVSSVKIVAENAPTIYPNPTQDICQVQFQTAVEGSYEIRNITGQLVSQAPLSQQTTIDLEAQPKGVYILVLSVGTQQWSRRILKL